MSVKIIPFIFNWKNQFENAKRLENQLLELYDEVVVINSDSNNSRKGWIDVGEEAYYTAQFLAAIERFDGDIMFQLQADVSYQNWQVVIDNALKYHEKYNWGIFAPNVDFTGWMSKRVNIESNYLSEPDLSLVACTDCTCWFIHGDIIRLFKEYKPLFLNNKYGWGVDLLMYALAYTNKRPVIRDYNHTVAHPRGRGYNSDEAELELEKFINDVDGKLKPVLQNILNDRQLLCHFLESESQVTI